MLKGKHLLRQSANQMRQETAYIKNNDREKTILLKECFVTRRSED
jgi:hypothetical protein